ncbi:MAG: lysophospholipid acyltransferase family protein [Victivallaceae bacterium]|nr:lysophospholipid acyltransferase family protein [Victivallaceae bacterium]
MGYLKQKFRSIKKFPTWIYWLPSHLMWLMLRTIYSFRIDDPHHYIENTKRAVAVSWHNRLFFFAVAFPHRVLVRTVAVVSPSRDGQYIADLISTLGLRSLRGSSSKQGAHAQLAAMREIQAGHIVAFTPDGPRGPRYGMKLGPVHLASATGVSIIPVSINASRVWSLHSWDGFQIPKPFSRITLTFGESFEVPSGLDAAGLEEYRKKAEAALMAITVDPQREK